jgi:hypothetical protein
MRHQPNTETVLNSLAELSSRDEQERLWLSTGVGGAEVSSPVEAVCTLFDDSGLQVALDWARRQREAGRQVSAEPVYNVDIDERFEALGKLLDRLPHGSPHHVINSPDMEAVRIAAAQLRTDLMQLVANE